MQLKIFTQLLALTYLLTCNGTPLSAYPGGCYECEEEVWEEVPCDEIPSNSTTIEPPYTTPRYTTPTSPTTPETTTTTSTTTTSTTTSTTTTTTPRSVEPPTTEKDPYQKCYCECKVGCKEFCRKVVVNPDVEKKIVEVSKITEKVAKGNVELTHYHQRELIPKISYANPASPTAVATAVASYADSDSNGGLHTQHRAYKPKPYVPLPMPSPVIYQPPEISASQTHPHGPSIYSYPSQANAHSYAHANADLNNIGADLSYSAKPVAHHHYYSSPPSELYDFQTPFDGVYSKVVKTILAPVGNSIQLALTSSNNIPKHNVQCQKSGSYSSPTPVKTSAGLGSHANYDGSIESYIKDFLSESDSHNFGTYGSYSPHYSITLR